MPGPQNPQQPNQSPWYGLNAPEHNQSWLDELIGAPTAIIGGLTGLPTPDTPLKRWTQLAGTAAPVAAGPRSFIDGLSGAAGAAGQMGAGAGAARAAGAGTAEVLDLSQPLSDTGRAGILRAAQGLPQQAQQHAYNLAADAHLQMPYAQRMQTVQTLLDHDPQFFQKAGYAGVQAGPTPGALAPRPAGGPDYMTGLLNSGFEGRAQQMGDQTLNTLRGGGYQVPPGGFQTHQDIDRFVASGPVRSQNPAFTRFASEPKSAAPKGIQILPSPPEEPATPGSAMTKFRRQQQTESELARERQQMRRGR